jgi:ADP-heptose:LPS heptosyltransferase
MKKILIIRFSSIGDIVLTTPVIRCLKLQQSGTSIHYLTKKSFASLLENNPYVDKVHYIEKTIKEIVDELKNEHFDAIIDLHNNLRSMQVKWILGKPSTSFKKLNFRKWLLVNFKINTMPSIHVVDRYMQTISHMGIKNDGNGLDYFIPKKDEIPLQSLPITHQKGFIGFVIGAKHFTKQLPNEKIISICKQLKYPLILLGGKEDKQRGDEISKVLGNTIYNACGIYNLNQSASLVLQASFIISHDTGFMHIAAAFKKEIFSIWGNTVPAFGFAPYGASDKSKIIEVTGLSCRPCSKIGYDKCPKGHFKCMNEIDTAAITCNVSPIDTKAVD